MPVCFLVVINPSIMTQLIIVSWITVEKPMLMIEAKKNLIKNSSRQEFQAHFTKWWDSRKGTPGQLHAVLIIDNPKLKYQFQKYHSTLSMKTINQYFHGTSLKCAIYQNTTVCRDDTFGICGVGQKGMLPNFKAKFQRFGDGFYLAPNSFKYHDYTQAGHNKCHAMLLFDVAEGKKYKKIKLN